jgi:Na+/H+ antiporter NhaD/arsenite permease-like protein
MTARRWLDWLKAYWLLFVLALLAVVLAMVDPHPPAAWVRWLQAPTLAGLAGLLIAIQGIRDSAFVQHTAAVLAARTHSLRSLGLLLVAAAALLSMILTNDVSLFLLVPLTVAIGSLSNLPVLRMVVLEALAVNAGSTLSPIGNPQNLLLWQHGQLPFLAFARAMLPAAAVMLALVATLTWVWLPRERVALAPAALDRQAVAGRLAALSLAALVAMVVAMEYGHAALGAGTLLVVFALAAPRSLLRLDWLLLLTFAAIFLGLGHLAELPQVDAALDRIDFARPLTLYLCGVLASQLISNVPSTVLLLERARDPIALAVAVNVGGFGLAIGSLANLIALRLARQPQGWRALHRASVPFVLVCAPLVYMVWRWLG